MGALTAVRPLGARLSPSEMYPAGVAGLSSRFVTLRSGLTVRVVEGGPPDGAPVLLLAGWGGSIYLYRHNLPALADAGFRVLAVDMKGQGLSDKPADGSAYTSAAMTAHALEILDALGLARVRLVGQSMAGKIAANVALEAPARVERLVLIDAVGIGRVRGVSLVRHVPVKWLDVIEPFTSRVTFWAVLRRAYGSLAHFTLRDVEEYYAPTADPNFVRALFLLLRHFDWEMFTREQLARLTMPVLLVVGTEDHLVTPDQVHRMAAALPHAESLVVEGAGHIPNEEAPEAVNRALVRFLSA